MMISTIRETQIKSIMMYHLNPVRITIIKNINTNVSKDMEKMEFFCAVGRKVN
jgi:hypothetical protein